MMRHAVLALTTAVVLLTATVASAFPARPDQVPLRRLLNNVAAYVKAHPNDPNGYYTLGRLNYFVVAAATKADKGKRGKPNQLPVYFEGDDNNLPSLYSDSPRDGGPVSFRRSHKEQMAFLRDAVRNLTHAIELRDAPAASLGEKLAPARTPGLFELCLGCVLEEGAPLAKEAGALPPIAPTPDPDAWREAAISTYKLAYDRAQAAERDATEDEKSNDQSVSYEASELWLKMVQKRGPTLEEKGEIAQVEVERKRMKARRSVISPIVLSLTPDKRLNDLLDNKRRVSFDLHGDGLKRTHTWLKPDTGLLVWDPESTGKITSGKQLFGSVSWWLFWANGYQALAALDDNRDGKLTGGELAGLALWFDRNQNGVSDKGEVVPLERTPIVSLSVRWTGRVGQSWESKGGATLRDGTKLTTWDWVTR